MKFWIWAGPGGFEASIRSYSHLLWPLKGHLLQGIEVHLGVDEGGLKMAMAEHVGDCLQAMTFVKHSGGKAMPKGM